MSVKEGVRLSTLSYVILYVPNAKEALSFYRDILGLTVKFDEEGWIEFESGATTVALHSEQEPDANKGKETTTLVFTVDDIEKAYEELKSKGIKFDKEPKQVCETPDHVGLSADFYDPYGNSLSIFSMVPRKK